MKFSVKLIAAALCAAMLCVPALAAASAPARGLRPEPQYTVISGTVAHQEGRRLVDEHVHRRTNGGLYPVDGGRYDPGRRQRRAGGCKVPSRTAAPSMRGWGRRLP
ncbi:MAG: hypothetical protein ACLU38_11875 [Dysosmobacter sp.]